MLLYPTLASLQGISFKLHMLFFFASFLLSNLPARSVKRISRQSQAATNRPQTPFFLPPPPRLTPHPVVVVVVVACIKSAYLFSAYQFYSARVFTAISIYKKATKNVTRERGRGRASVYAAVHDYIRVYICICVCVCNSCNSHFVAGGGVERANRQPNSVKNAHK